MKTGLRALFGLAIVLGVPFSLMAGTITLSPTSTRIVLYGTDQSNAVIEDKIADFINNPAISVLYKAEQKTGTPETGSFAGSYQTQFDVSGLENASARVTYVGGPVIGNPSYAAIKDGKIQDSGVTWYLFDLTGWNGTDTIDFTGFFAGNQGRISHVEILGTVPVPDGGLTVILLGLAVIGLIGIRRAIN